jgi:hypothetical protein
MTGKLEKKGSEKKTLTSKVNEPIKRRGRPKGAKNKPKSDKVEIKEKRPRGRPPGAKNKPKLELAPEVSIKGKYLKNTNLQSTSAISTPKPLGKRGRPRKNDIKPEAPPTKDLHGKAVQGQEQIEHILFTLIAWLEKHMHHNELQYYRSRASRNGVTLQNAIASDILGFFNIQNAEICKYVKRNTFIANVTKHELH